MKINPLNVVNLLLAYFQTTGIPNSVTNYKEIELSEKLKQILIDAANDFNEVDMIVEDTLDFQEEYKDCDAKIIEDEVHHHFLNPMLHQPISVRKILKTSVLITNKEP